MLKLTTTLVATVLIFGCDDDDDILDGDDMDMGDMDGDGDDTPGVLEWNADLMGGGIYSDLLGQATVRQDVGAQSFFALASVRNDEPGAVRPWHVHFGQCASGGEIVGEDRDYPRLVIGADGSAEAEVVIDRALDPAMDYHVNVHLSDAQQGTIIACGDLIRGQP